MSAPKEPLSVSDTIDRGQEFLFSIQRDDHHWCAELESNPTIASEYVFLRRILGLDLAGRGPELARYLLSRQNEDGSWGIAQPWDGDVSTTTEAYLALRILGLGRERPELERAERYVRRHGGIERVRVFTRVFLAMFGLAPWSTIPALPPELVLLPPRSPVNIYRLASWARGTMVPLLVIFHHQPVFALPNGLSRANDWLDPLWLDPAQKRNASSSSLLKLFAEHRLAWKSVFGAANAFLKAYERIKIGPLRKRALDRCILWILERQEGTGGWAGIFPPMINSLIALTLEGYPLGSDPVRKGLEAIERFSWEDHRGFRIQACESPVWDTALATISLIDSGADPARAELARAAEWILSRQNHGPHGDWRVYRPDVQPGGWSFEYHNSWYPDVDDTAAVVLMLLKQAPGSSRDRAVRVALDWMIGMQNKDGGWAAFDFDNDKAFLNEIPFSDMDSLCDPSTPDVTGRVLEAVGLWLRGVGSGPVAEDSEAPQLQELRGLRRRAAIARHRAVRYLRKSQERQGSWFGRWGVNYVYGTSNALCGLAQAGIAASDPMVEAALTWLRHVQNPDGGWGESIASYADPRWMGRGESTPSQTSWGLMGLLSHASFGCPDPAIERGVRWLVDRQLPAGTTAASARQGGVPVPSPRGGTWEEAHFTGTGFPKHFYLRYHLYRHYFPMMALGRYRRGFAG